MTGLRGSIAFLAIGQTLVWAALFYSFPALLLEWESDLGWSRTQITGAATLAILLSGLFAPLAGRIIDNGQGAHLMAGAALLGATAIAFLSHVTTLWQFYLCWAVAGIAMAGALYEPCFAILTRAKGAGAKGPITAITLIAGFAGTIGFPLFNIGADAIGWRSTMQVAAVITALMVTPLLWFGVKGLGRDVADPQPKEPVTGKLWAGPVFLLLAIGFSLTALVHAATLHHLLPLLDEKTVDPGFAVFVAALIGPMQVLGRIVMALTGRYISPHFFAVGVFGTMALAVATLWFSQGSQMSLVAFVVLFGASYGTISILRPVLAHAILGGAGFGAKSGALALPYRVAAALAPYLGSLAWWAGGYSLMLGIGLFLAILGAMFYLAAHLLQLRGKNS